jgi:hypothetical protein
MDTQQKTEIRASVGAFGDLGPGYDQAVAEGLVERIGEEIDRRITAEVERQVNDIDDRMFSEVDSRVALELDRHVGCRHVRRQRRRSRRQEMRADAVARARRSTTWLTLGSMSIGTLITMIILLSSRSDGGGAPTFWAMILTAFVWIGIVAINLAHARRPQ